MLRELAPKIFYHHSEGTGGDDAWHNDLHDGVNRVVEKLKKPLSPAEVKKLRVAASNDINQLKISARMLGAGDDEHWLQAVLKLNEVLPGDQKIYISPSIPQV